MRMGLGLSLAIQAASVGVADTTNYMDAIIVVGQSNAGGVADDAATLSYTPDTQVKTWNGSAFVTYAPQTVTGAGPAGATYRWGGEMEYSRQFRAANPTKPLRVIKYFELGTQLASTGNATLDWAPTSTGELFDQAKTLINAAIAAIAAEGFVPRVRVLFWMQGESDASSSGPARAYNENAAAFWSAVRAQWNIGTPKIVIGRIADVAAWPFRSDLHAAQAAIVVANADMALVNTDAYGMSPDGMHYNKAGLIAMGEDIWKVDQGIYADGLAAKGSFSLDFTTGTYVGATPYNTNADGGFAEAADGTLVQFSANTVRRTTRGLLSEPSRANLVYNPNNLTTSWTLTGCSAALVSMGLPTGATGNASRLTLASGASSQTRIFQSGYGSASAKVKTFYYRRGGTVPFLHIRMTAGSTWGSCINTATGAVTTGYYDGATAALAPTSCTVKQLTNGWDKVTFIAPTTGAGIFDFVYFSKSATTTQTTWAGTETLDIGYFVTINGSVETSYVSNAGVPGSYAADAVKFVVPLGKTSITLTFDDDTNTTVAVTPGPYTIPTTYAPKYIETIGTPLTTIQTQDGNNYTLDTARKPWSATYDAATDTISFEMRAGDYIGGAQRSEISAFGINNVPVGTPYYGSFYLTIPAGDPNTAPWMTLLQAHQINGLGDTSGSQMFGLEMHGENLRFGLRHTDPNAPTYVVLFLEGPNIVRGQEYKFDVYYKMHPTDGYVYILRDGVVIVNYTGPACYTDTAFTYWKQGIYRGDAAETYRMRVRALRNFPASKP